MCFGCCCARELADLELPDYDYLSREPDFVHRIQARGAVTDQLLAGTMFDDSAASTDRLSLVPMTTWSCPDPNCPPTDIAPADVTSTDDQGVRTLVCAMCF